MSQGEPVKKSKGMGQRVSTRLYPNFPDDASFLHVKGEIEASIGRRNAAGDYIRRCVLIGHQFLQAGSSGELGRLVKFLDTAYENERNTHSNINGVASDNESDANTVSNDKQVEVIEEQVPAPQAHAQADEARPAPMGGLMGMGISREPGGALE